MSESGIVLECCETLAQGPYQVSSQWHHQKNDWRSTNSQPLDRYEWNTSTPAYLRQLSTLTNLTHRSCDQPRGPSQVKPRSLRRVLPYFRSISEPGTGRNNNERKSLGKASREAVARASSFRIFISSLSRGISRILRHEADDEEPGRTVHLRCHLFLCVSLKNKVVWVIYFDIIECKGWSRFLEIPKVLR